MRPFPYLLLALLPCLASSRQSPALPVSPSEYSVLTIGDPEAAVKVDSFIDLACSDTKATWPTLKKVMSHYEEKGVEFRYHLFPLPYHTFAFYLAKAAVILQAKTNATSTFTFFDTAFSRQEEILNGPTAEKTPTDVKDRVREWATQGTGLTEEEFDQGWTDDYLEMNTRFEFKYTASRGVIGTPTFFINQMWIPDLGSESSLRDWTSYIDPLIRPRKLIRLEGPDLSAYRQQDGSSPSLDMRSVIVVGGILVLLVGMVAYIGSRLGRSHRLHNESSGASVDNLTNENEGTALISNDRRQQVQVPTPINSSAV